VFILSTKGGVPYSKSSGFIHHWSGGDRNTCQTKEEDDKGSHCCYRKEKEKPAWTYSATNGSS
jgi:hypothetical protein